MCKHQFKIGTGAGARILNFEGNKKVATDAAERWAKEHPQYEGVEFVKTLSTKKPRKTTLHKMYKGGKQS